MRPFRTDGGTFESSIALATSDSGQTTVTTAVRTTRDAEPAVLDSLYRLGYDYPFEPFATTSVDYQAHREFCERVVRANRVRIAAVSHSGTYEGEQARAARGSRIRNVEQIKVVQAAMVLDDVLARPAEALVLVNGNEARAEGVAEALAALRDERVAVAPCVQSRRYYPAALLASVAASHLAHRIEHGDRGDEWLRVGPDAASRPEWGRIFAYRNGDPDPVELHHLPNVGADPPRGRVACWFRGGGVRDLETASDPDPAFFEEAVAHLEERGYGQVAKVLAELPEQ